MATPKKLDTGVGKLSPPPPLKADDGKWSDSLLHLLNRWLRELTQKLNGGLSLGDTANYAAAGNLDAVWVVYYFASAATEYQIPHPLGRVPVGYVVCVADRLTVIYTSTLTGWGTPTDMYLKSSAATATVRLLVF